MTAIELEVIIYPSIVTLLAVLQLREFSRRCNRYREELEPDVFSLKGGSNCERAVHAYHRILEMFPLFLVTLWMTGLFFNQGTASVVSLVYLYSRERYFSAYIRSIDDRVPGSALGDRCLKLQLLLSVCGVIMSLMHMYWDILDRVVRRWLTR